MRHEVNGIEIITDDVTEAGLRREHAYLGGRSFPSFFECLIEQILDAYDIEVSGKIVASIKLFEYKYKNFGITFNFDDGSSYTINP